MTIDDLLRVMTEAGDRAVEEVRREAGWSQDEGEPVSSDEVNAYIEKLEDAVRANAGAVRLAAMTQGR